MGAVFCGFMWILAALEEQGLGLLRLVIYMKHF